MKKLVFNVSSKENCSVVSLIKEINKISCRISIDIEKGIVTVEDINYSMVDKVIELIDNYYTIMTVDIDNTCEENTQQQVASVNTTEDAVVPNIEEVSEETTEVLGEKEPTVLETQSEDELNIRKVEFENEYVESRINNFLKTAYWAMYTKNATEKDIGNYIITCMSEISMRYSSKPIIDFSIGDIVDVNYGLHIPGEVVGGHVSAIVCNRLDEKMVYLVPIIKRETDDIISKSYLFMDVSEDATYDNENHKKDTVLISKGKYVRAERINSVIGRTNPEFFKKLLYQIALTFDFTDTFVETNADLPFTMEETSVVEDNEGACQTSIVKDENTDKVAEDNTKKVGDLEASLLEVIGNAVEKLDNSKPYADQIESFMAEIGLPTEEGLIKDSFFVACIIKKINYENIIAQLHDIYSHISETNIKATLQQVFKSWLEQHPELAAKCPKISFMAILKVFAKKFA